MMIARKQLENTFQNTFSRFFRMESAGGIVLVFSAILAIILANSGLKDLYFEFLHMDIALNIGNFSISNSVSHWINDGLMAIFFFVIGLEIKRELIAGELQSIKQSALPIIAAVGGMLIPVLVFLMFHTSNYERGGWGIPMATDIAFSLGILQLLGKRVPLSLKIFLTAFAIIDDLGAVLVIALFYSTGIAWNLIGIAMALYAVLILMTFFSINARYFYLLSSVIIWYLFLQAGIHPTIAGILMAFVIPIKSRIKKNTFSQEMNEVIHDFDNTKRTGLFLNHQQLNAIDRAKYLVNRIQPYLQTLENSLHSWVAFFILPVFAFANAGVVIFNGGAMEIHPVAWHIALAIFFGKIIGISSFSWLAVKTGLASFPENTSFKHIVGISFLGAIGFTMALFIDNLAFTDELYLNSAKLGIIISSVIAGVLGFFILKKTLNPPVLAT